MLPWWHRSHNQGETNSCVGHGTTMERAITNTAQNRVLAILKPTRRYNPLAVWEAAKAIDEWAETKPGDNEGTSVRAGYDVLRSKGARKVAKMTLVGGVPVPVGEQDWDQGEGIAYTRWARSVDEMRAAIADGMPSAIGVTWYTTFYMPVEKNGQWWLATHENWGTNDGGHCVCVYGASDKRQAFRVKNSWPGWPLVWLPYKAMERLLSEDGEAALTTDK